MSIYTAALAGLGFGADAIDVIEASEAEVLANPEPAPFERQAIWADACGAMVAFGTAPGGEPYVLPMVRGGGSGQVVAYRLTDVLADVVYVDERDGDISARLIAGLEAPGEFPQGDFDNPSKVGEARMFLSAVGLEGVALYRDAEDFEAKAGAELPEGAPHNGRHIMAPSYDALRAGGEAAAAEPVALLGAEIVNSQKRTNPLTGEPFWYIEALSAVPVTIALAYDALPDGEIPIPGMTIAGTFLLGISS